MAKKNIKGEILNISRRMWSRLGCDNVALRDIASALDISVGNLTYHFARKEALAEALIEETRQGYKTPEAAKTLPQLNALFAIMQNDIIYNAFLFWHTTLLAQSTPSITALQYDIASDQCTVINKSLENLHAAGFIIPQCYKGHYGHLAHSLHLLCVYWAAQSTLWQPPNEEHPAQKTDYLQCIWSSIYALLTEEGRKVYTNKVLKVRMHFD